MTYIKLTRFISGLDKTEIHYVRSDLIQEFSSRTDVQGSWVLITGHDFDLAVDQSVDEIKRLIDNGKK